MSEHEQDAVAHFFQRAAAETRPPRPLPSAGQIWWRAEIIQRLTEKEKQVARVLRPLRWVQAAAMALCGAALLFLISWLTLRVASDGAAATQTLLLTLVSGGVPLVGFVFCWLLWREAG